MLKKNKKIGSRLTAFSMVLLLVVLLGGINCSTDGAAQPACAWDESNWDACTWNP